MKDFVDQDVGVGDFVFYTRKGRYENEILGKVVSMTPNNLVVEIIKAKRPEGPNGCIGDIVRIYDSRQCIKVDSTRCP